MSLKAARSERERAFIKRATKWVIGLAVVFSIGLTVLVLQGPALVRRSPLLFTIAITTLVLAYTVALLAFIIWMNRRQARIRLEDGTSVMPTEEIAAQMPAVMRRWQYPAVYESRLRLLGLPLVSIRFNGVNGTLAQRRPALGWIAIGDVAIGVLFASGSLAIGGIACGALGLGVFSFAGLAFGFFAAGGGAVGALALGGFATGILASGGIALAWHAAKGGAAVARNLAIGGLAVAENANDAVAKHFLDDHWFFQLGDLMATHGWLWFGLVALMLLPVFWARQVVTSGVGRS